MICRAWERHGNRLPDFVVVEGSRAGGHLGFSAEELADGSAKPLDEIVSDVVETLRPYEEKCGRKIPVFPAGGVYDGADIARLEKLGAAGAQIATRFIATEECDAAPAYKQAMVDAKEEDVRIIKSPVGMPGRALFSPLIRKVAELGRIAPSGACSVCAPATRRHAVLHYPRSLCCQGRLGEGTLFLRRECGPY